MALIAMEQPLSFEAEHIRAEKLKVLQAVRPLVRDNLAVGQYSGTDSKLGYLDDPSLQNKVHSPHVTSPHPAPRRTPSPFAPSRPHPPLPPCPEQDSCTETFAAAVLHVHNPRWDGVPFVLKARRPYAPHTLRTSTCTHAHAHMHMHMHMHMQWHVHCACTAHHARAVPWCVPGGQGGALRGCTKGVH